MKILFIAPLPPPITGQSIISNSLRESLELDNEVITVNYNKNNYEQGIASSNRIIKVFKILHIIWREQKKADLIYLTISQSILGNIKDLITYLLCYKNLSKVIIHLHGGGLKQQIFDKSNLLRYLNTFFLSRVRAVLVLGESLKIIFDGIVNKSKIIRLPNFVEDDLFLKNGEYIKKKFSNPKKIKITYLSNLLRGKGYDILLEAFLQLEDKIKKQYELTFAGEFEDDELKKYFLKKIENTPIKYIGIVIGQEKIELLRSTHIFCLPTYYAFGEGQPISILEAYSSGCVVLTTAHGGIPDVFKEGVNGFLLEKRSISSIKRILISIYNNDNGLFDIAKNNLELAKRNHSKSKYLNNFKKILESIN